MATTGENDQTSADEARLLPVEVATPVAMPEMRGTEMSALDAETIRPTTDGVATSSTAARWQAGTLTYTASGLAVLFCILLMGDFALQMRERSVGTPVQYMLKRLHASDTLIAIAFSFLPPLLSLLVVPIASVKSDRTRTRWGRRIPYLLIPAPLAALGMVLVSYSEVLGPRLSEFAANHGHVINAQRAALTIFTVAWVTYEVAVLIGNAILTALINDVVPRGLLGRFYGLFRAVSLIAGMLFNFWLINYSESHFRAIFIALAVLFIVGFGAMCLGVKEGQYPEPPPVDPNDTATRRFTNAVAIYFRECFSIPYFRWAFAALSLSAVAIMPINLFSAIYAKQLDVSTRQYGIYMGVTYCCSLILAAPLGYVVDKAHALRVSLGMMAVYAVAMLTSFCFITGPRSFGVAFLIHGVLSGCYYTTSAPLAQALFPRLKFATFASAQGMVQSLLTMAMALTIGPLLDATHHFYRLTFLMGGVLAAGAVLTLLVVYAGFNRLGGVLGYVPPEVGGDVVATTVPKQQGFEVLPK